MKQIRVPGIWAGYWDMDKVCQYLRNLQKCVLVTLEYVICVILTEEVIKKSSVDLDKLKIMAVHTQTL